MPTKIFLTGASSGIGRIAAEALCEAGYDVWGTSRSLSRLPTCHGFHAVELDLLDPVQTEQTFLRMQEESGGFDVLINNAGTGVFAPLEGQTSEFQQLQFRLLYHAPMQLIQLTLPRFRERNHGRILNITSLAARLPIPFLGAYSAAKAALSSASETLRHELCHTRIKIIDLQPGDIHTGFHEMMNRQDASWHEAYAPTLRNAWGSIDHNMKHAPPPACVTRAILRAVQSPNPPPVLAAGDFFQTQIAPLGLRLLPRSLMEWTVQRFYNL